MQLLISLKQLYLNQGNTETPKYRPGTIMKCRLVIIHNNNNKKKKNNQLSFNNI